MRHEENLVSAKLLIHNHSHYSSSIHCSYYSVFQYMLHLHKKWDTQLFRKRDKLAGFGSHDLVINETFAILVQVDRASAGFFKRDIIILKQARVVADYREEHVDYTRSIVAFEIAQRLTQILSGIAKR